MTADPRIDTDLAGYRIETLLGRGGMGVVYRAEQTRLGRKVALKLLSPELAANEGFRVRFEHESRLAAAIDHPNIIPLYEAGEADGLLFITMRYVEGTDLKALVAREGPMDLRRAVAVVAQLASALDAAHDRGLVHRDVKPANVLVSSGAGPESSDHCYLTDFGLTKDTSSSVELTATGQFVGTIAYVAPEQIEGTAQTGATDQYALGCVLYECLTGHPPFERKTELDIMWAHLSDDPPTITERRPDLPPALDDVLAKALAKSPEDRYETCTAMVAAARATLPAATGAAPGVSPAGPTVAAGATRLSPPPAGPTAVSPEVVPAGPTRPAPAPADRVAAPARPRGRGGLIAAALAAVVVAAVAGTLLGGSGDKVAPEAGNVAATGGLSLRVPAAWETLGSPPDIPGLEFQDRIAIGPRAAAGREGLVAGRIPAGEGSVLPAGLADAGGDGPPARDAVRLGDAEAFRYPGLRPERAPGASGFAGSVTLFVVLTDKGHAGIACYAAAPSPRFSKASSDVAASLELTDAKALALAPSAEFAKAVTDLLARMAGERRRGRQRLAQAATSVSQAAAADALARAYAAASRRARGLPAPDAARPANTAIATAIAEVAHGYEIAAAAARGRDRARFRRAGGAVRRAEARVTAAVGALAELGYAVRA